ncbi:hypothetical protein KAW55_04580 [bacterium]|nr:hypothetical protein [bacterium]
MPLVGTEQNILKIVAELKQASAFQINRQTGLSLGYVEYLCSYLVRGDYLKSLGQSRYCLAPEGKRVLVSLGYGLGLDKELVKELASQVAKEVAKEIKIEGGIKVSPEEEREKIKIKTDYSLPVEDESVGLVSNIDKVGSKLEKEKGDSLDTSVRLLRSIKKKGKKR